MGQSKRCSLVFDENKRVTKQVWEGFWETVASVDSRLPNRAGTGSNVSGFELYRVPYFGLKLESDFRKISSSLKSPWNYSSFSWAKYILHSFEIYWASQKTHGLDLDLFPGSIGYGAHSLGAFLQARALQPGGVPVPALLANQTSELQALCCFFCSFFAFWWIMSEVRKREKKELGKGGPGSWGL